MGVTDKMWDAITKVIRMDDKDRCQPRAAQPVNQLAGDPLGNHDRQARVDSQAADVIESGQSSGQLAEL